MASMMLNRLIAVLAAVTVVIAGTGSAAASGHLHSPQTLLLAAPIPPCMAHPENPAENYEGLARCRRTDRPQWQPAVLFDATLWLPPGAIRA
jgi:hypothetical protein